MGKMICISDTHGLHRELTLPPADILVVAGDFQATGQAKSEEFNDWLGSLDFKHKIIIAGNHDWYPYHHSAEFRKIITNAVYLENEEVIIDGVKFYGSPMTPTFLDWAFMKDRGDDIQKYWDNIPDDTNVLITHGPPLGILDFSTNEHCGCWDLNHAIETRLKALRFHIFGHIHSEGGKTFVRNDVQFINASVMDDNYEIREDGKIIDL